MSELFGEIVRLHNSGTPCVLATVVRTAGSTPRKAAARMLVRPDGSIAGTIGGGRIEKEVVEAALALLAAGAAAAPRLLRYHLTHELAMCCGGEMEVFVEPLMLEPTLVVCGGGHVAHALVPMARACGWRVLVVEEAEEMASAARFPDAARIIESFDVRDWSGVPIDADTAIVIVTRDHAQDQALLEQLLTLADGREPGYLGLIGSRRKVELFRQRLTARGVDAARFARVHAPIGLDIGAETPAEIAVAILAQLVQQRAARRSAGATAARAEVRAGEARAGEARGSEARASEARGSEARASEARASEARASEARAGEARASEARASEARAGEGRVAGEPHAGAVRKERT
jgi:xanthine dehydrogenase accessory factor